jgi:NADPH:quinone reductase-like Zn-dependent oxidoreductase
LQIEHSRAKRYQVMGAAPKIGIQMRVITQTEFGDIDVLHEAQRPRPDIKPDELLVRVAAAGVNPVDLAVRSGTFPLLGDPPFILGWDIAGIVEETGATVTDFSVGDRVFGMPRFPKEAGGYAEYAAVPATQMCKTPDALTDIEAAALPLAGLTAWQALVETASLTAGQRVLVHAGAGGVGHLALQIARARDAEVITTVSFGKVSVAEALGADLAIDYQANDFTRQLQDIDLVLDSVGGEHVLRSIEVTRDGGMIVCLKPPSEEAVAAAAGRNVRLEALLVHPDAAGLSALAAMVQSGTLKIRVDTTFPLAEANEAHAILETGPIGKVVLEV